MQNSCSVPSEVARFITSLVSWRWKRHRVSSKTVCRNFHAVNFEYIWTEGLNAYLSVCIWGFYYAILWCKIVSITLMSVNTRQLSFPANTSPQVCLFSLMILRSQTLLSSARVLTTASVCFQESVRLFVCIHRSVSSSTYSIQSIFSLSLLSLPFSRILVWTCGDSFWKQLSEKVPTPWGFSVCLECTQHRNYYPATHEYGIIAVISFSKLLIRLDQITYLIKHHPWRKQFIS